jgi:hypothetical protein
MQTLIIQASFPRSASTLLVNALYGMIPGLQNEPVAWHDFERSPLAAGNPAVRIATRAPVSIIKTHSMNIDAIYNAYKGSYNVFFVCSERAAHGFRLEDRYRRYKNVVVFDYDELNERPDYDLPAIISRIHSKLAPMLGPILQLNRSIAYERVADMNAYYKEIENLPFDYTDPFFNLHGSHRKRGPMQARAPLLRGVRGKEKTHHYQ